MATKKTTAKKTTRKTTRKSTARTTTTAQATATTEIPVREKSCAYPSCSARATETFGDNKVPSCDHHASIFKNQADDGAGIQLLMANYKG